MVATFALKVKVVRNSRQARVNGGRSHDSSQGSQRSACPSEWKFTQALLQLRFSSRWWTLTKRCGSQSSEWEERKKIRAKRGSLCEPCKPRKTVFLFPLPWQVILVTMRPHCGCWATSGRPRSRRALQVCLSCTCFSCCISPGMSIQQSVPILAEHLLQYAWTCVYFQ